MTATTDSMEEISNRELTASRVLNASRERIFDAISDPAQLAQWWGPNGFTNTFQEFDFRIGGNWRFVMHGPDGKDYPNESQFADIVKSERVVIRHASHPRFTLSILLTDAGNGKTKIDWRQLFETAEVCERVKVYAIPGNEQNLDRLKAHLEKVSSFIISRTFDVPRDIMWKAWSERLRLMEWFGPKGFKMPAAKMDFRPGGSFHYCLESPDGNEMWGKFIYREISAPKKMVLVDSFSDEAGGLTRHPLTAIWPLEILSTFTFTEKNGRTTATVEWIPVNPTEEERKIFDASHDAIKQGWTGTLEQLAAYLAKV